MSKDPTNNQQKVLEFIDKFMLKNGFSPTFGEIAKGLNVSVGTIQDQLKALRAKRKLFWIPNKQRSIKLAKSDPISSTPLPLLGTISAGEGITVYEESEPEVVAVPSDMISHGFAHYCLRVSGFSMSEDGILDGDLIVVRQQASAYDGDAVVAVVKGLYEEKAAIKRFYHQGDKIELRPRNQELRSKFYDPEEIEVRGKFRGLIRSGEEVY